MLSLSGIRRFLLLLFSLYVLHAKAQQDRIHLCDQHFPIKGNVTGISDSAVSYRVRPGDPVFAVRRQRVSRIEYGDGSVLVLDSVSSAQWIAERKRRPAVRYDLERPWNFKVNCFTPLLGYTVLNLERGLKPGMSLEYTLNLIGAGVPQYRLSDPLLFLGAGAGMGVKFIHVRKYRARRQGLQNMLSGGFVKFGMTANYYRRTFPIPNHDHIEYKPYVCWSVNPAIGLGKQMISRGGTSFELYWTVGVSIDNLDRRIAENSDDIHVHGNINDNAPYNGFGCIRFDNHLTLGAGIRVGGLFY